MVPSEQVPTPSLPTLRVGPLPRLSLQLFLLRTSAKQASLIALGLSSVHEATGGHAIQTYPTATSEHTSAIVTDKSDYRSVTMDVYHTAEESGKTLTVWQENGWFAGISYHTAEESRETLTVWQIKDSSECIAPSPDMRAPDLIASS